MVYISVFSRLQACDAVIGGIVIRYDRYQHLDFLQPWTSGPLVLVIPSPNSSLDLSSVGKPFQTYVRSSFNIFCINIINTTCLFEFSKNWVVLAVSISSAIVALVYFDSRDGTATTNFYCHVVFVYGLLLNQG